MSERKVLNKYYPPDFDPSKIPKMRCPKNRTFSIRIMAPFNMRCNTCGEYIYKGKKFNSRKENVDDEYYLGLRIFRFYIKCPKCVAEIAFKTDLQNTDYALEAGATRLFEAEKMAQKMAEQERREKEAEELNPMKVLENRTKASRNEIEQLDTLEELRDLNAKNANMNHERMIELHQVYEEQLKRLQDEEEENMIRSIFGQKDGNALKRLADFDSSDSGDERKPSVKKKPAPEKPTDIFAEDLDTEKKQDTKKQESWQKSVGSFSSKQNLISLVKKKDGTNNIKTQETEETNDNQSNGTTGGSLSGITQSDASQGKSAQSNSTVSGLGMLGNYSDSDSDGNSESN